MKLITKMTFDLFHDICSQFGNLPFEHLRFIYWDIFELWDDVDMFSDFVKLRTRFEILFLVDFEFSFIFSRSWKTLRFGWDLLSFKLFAMFLTDWWVALILWIDEIILCFILFIGIDGILGIDRHRYPVHRQIQD